METQLISKEKISTQTTNFADILMKSSCYSDLHENIIKSNIEYSEEKVFEIVSSGFFDFNHHLYKDINHMNSISTGLYIEMSLVTYRVFIWSAKGEGFEIFKHVLRGDEINQLKSINDIKEFLYIHINELEQGIVKTYGLDPEKSFEEFGYGIENKKLPLASILQYLSIDNNINDFR